MSCRYLLRARRFHCRSGPAAIAAMLAFVGAVGVVEAGAATAPRCRVRDVSAGTTSAGSGSNLQRAIRDASPGATLTINGVCVGTFTIGKRLTLVGKASDTFPIPTLDANSAGTVLTISGVVVVRDLRVRDGKSTYGGGMYTSNQVRLAGSTTVVGNRAETGAGIFNEGTLVLRDTASIRRNRASGDGGGIFHFAGALRLAGDSSVRANRARNGGGIFHESDQGLLKASAAVRANTATGDGGGISASGYLGDAVTLKGAAEVIGNVAGGAGGGIFLPSTGGAVYVCSARVAISPNEPDDPPPTQPCPASVSPRWPEPRPRHHESGARRSRAWSTGHRARAIHTRT